MALIARVGARLFRQPPERMIRPTTERLPRQLGVQRVEKTGESDSRGGALQRSVRQARGGGGARSRTQRTVSGPLANLSVYHCRRQRRRARPLQGALPLPVPSPVPPPHSACSPSIARSDYRGQRFHTAVEGDARCMGGPQPVGSSTSSSPLLRMASVVRSAKETATPASGRRPS